MSAEYRPAFASPHYSVERTADNLVTRAVAPGTPTALSAPAAGYMKGALWQNRSGSVGSLLYVNTGTTSVAVWTNIA